jgi:ATP-dependent Lon protease
MEQFKAIKKELGMESDGKDKLIEKFRETAAGLKMPEGVRKVFDEELAKLQGLEPAANEGIWGGIIWIGCLRFVHHIYYPIYEFHRYLEVVTLANYSISYAETALSEDHYRLTDVESHILKFLPVGKLRGTRGQIVRLVGPSVVGKTIVGSWAAKCRGDYGPQADVSWVRAFSVLFFFPLLKQI